MITLIGYSFEGPFLKTEYIPDLPGVFVIMDFNPNKGGYRVIDVGSAEDMRSGLENSDKKDNWLKEAKYSLTYAGCYTGSAEKNRQKVETRVGHFYNPPCWRGK